MKELSEVFEDIHNADILGAGLTFNALVNDCMDKFKLNLSQFCDLYGQWKSVNK